MNGLRSLRKIDYYSCFSLDILDELTTISEETEYLSRVHGIAPLTGFHPSPRLLILFLKAVMDELTTSSKENRPPHPELMLLLGPRRVLRCP